MTELLTLGGWAQVKFSDLRQGDVFRLFEPDGEPVEDGQEFTCCSDAYFDGVWGVKVEECASKE
jgi:hypothetical protein